MAITVPADVIKQPELAGVMDRATDDLLVLGQDCAVIGTLGEQMCAPDDATAHKAP